ASSTTLQGTTTINPTGTLAQNSTGSFTDLHISGTVELAGGGTLSLSDSPNNRIFATGTDTLINDAGNTIQGAGQLGINNTGFAFFLNNKGTINANQSAALQVAPTDRAGGVVNSGTLEATAGGTLLLTGGTFNNTGSGLILATGSGSVVDFNGSTITGGTLATQSGGAIQNSGTATLDGTTNSPTISNGSTVTLLNGTSTTLMGTITNKGTIAQSSSGSFTDLHISGTVELAGGGTLSLSDSLNNRIFATGTDTLINDAGNTIQGAGQLGINNSGFGFTLTNNGTILANAANALSIAPSGNTTNTGTFQADSGSTLFMNGTLTNYNAGTSTLTGGTYNALSGAIQFSQAGGGAVIATNAATILLSGASAQIADGSGNDILRNFLGTNSGSFTIQNGANLTTASTGFSNSGTVTIGPNSTFTVGGSNDYAQSGGTTTLTSGTSTLVVASGHSVSLNGGTLNGSGTIQGKLVNSGLVLPGLPGQAGVLTVTGNYTENPASTLSIQLGGPTAGTDFSQLSVLGTALLKGTLDVSLINGFTPSTNEQFVILTSAGLSGSFTDNVIHDGNVTFQVLYESLAGLNEVVLNTTAVPEPASLVLVGFGLACTAALRRRTQS
ncbi:MAG TPA: PEP-CTERM sorting domain-containing protein, partial [Myxococcota bacterium]|nr:PEP-CTERM sorting domain-containing protein [Myxococcota bacterium]